MRAVTWQSVTRQGFRQPPGIVRVQLQPGRHLVQQGGSPRAAARARRHAAAALAGVNLERATDSSSQANASHTTSQPVPKRRLACVVDDTEESWSAVRWTCENILREGDVLHLVHCVPRNSASVRVPLPAAFLATLGNESMDYEEMLEAHAHDFIQSTMLDQIHESRQAKCQVDVLHVGGPKSAASAVCKHSESINAALVVLAPLSAIDEWLTGGCIAKHVLDRCKQPTLVYTTHK